MFEYLMPLLVMRSYPDTLLDASCQMVVRRQIEYGAMRGVRRIERAAEQADAHAVGMKGNRLRGGYRRRRNRSQRRQRDALTRHAGYDTRPAAAVAAAGSRIGGRGGYLNRNARRRR